MRRSRGYVEVGQMFGWIVIIAVAVAGIYYGHILYDLYEDGSAVGIKAAGTFRDKYGGLKAAQFENALSAYLQNGRLHFPDRTVKERAYNQGWDDGFHNIVDKMLR